MSAESEAYFNGCGSNRILKHPNGGSASIDTLSISFDCDGSNRLDGTHSQAASQADLAPHNQKTAQAICDVFAKGTSDHSADGP